MEKRDLLERYEIRGDERDFAAAKPLYEEALAKGQDSGLLVEYGYLLECHARRELRVAVEQYRRAIELSPADDKPRYQLIQALAALFDTDEMVALYRERVAEAPGEVREYRFLASACLAAGRHAGAREAIATGLGFAPADAVLIALRGDLEAAEDDADGALADWRHAVELDPENIGPLYSSAFLLEREGRLGEAVDTWRSIVEWNEQRAYDLAAEYPRGELERVRLRG
jgi:tetratricopeptide (TPR) repeat protein